MDKIFSFSVAMATVTTPSKFFLLIIIALNYTIILICYMTWFDVFLVIKMLKNLKKHQKQAKSSSFSVAMATIITPSKLFLLIMIDLDNTIILICYMTWFDDFLVIKMLKNLKKRQKMLTLATLTVSMATTGFFAGNMKVPTCRACPRVLLVKILWKSLERPKSY